MKDLIDKLYFEQTLSREEYVSLIANHSSKDAEYLFSLAVKQRRRYYRNDIYIRGLIEFTNYCKNNCLYCGIRHNNKHIERYRLMRSQIIECCDTGYHLGFRTFVLQGGEDDFYSDDDMCDIIYDIKSRYPDCAVTLSIGEREYNSYKAFFDAGADRYLLRHETADDNHYMRLHPHNMSPEHRKKCLYNLKAIGYQVGCGFMVGSPYQTEWNLADDMLFIKELEPQMVGIGPFISQHNTPFASMKSGTLEQTLFMLGLIRLTLPNVLLPSTTALGTIHPFGREKGVLAGANVVMPNLSPVSVRKKYLLYDNKICTGDEAAECKSCLESRMKSIGYNIVVDRGDCAEFNKITGDNDNELQV